MKRGQITIFIIIGIILISVIAIYLFSKNYQSNDKKYPDDIRYLINQIQFCLKDSVEKSFYFFGIQGIDYNNSQDFGNLSFISIPYYYSLGQNHLPPISKIEEDVTLFTEIYFDVCINNFKSINKQGLEIRPVGSKKFFITIEQETIEASLKYPLVISKDDRTINIENFQITLDFNFLKAYDILQEFILEQEKNPDFIPIGHIGYLTNKENIIIQMANLPDNSVAYIFSFQEVLLKDLPYTVIFGVKYDWSDLQNNIILENETIT